MPLIVTPSTAGLTLSELLTEFYARGYDYLDDGAAGATRATRWINQAYFDICSRQNWPFLYADATGTAPLTISDLREVLSVTNTADLMTLQPEDRRTLLDTYADLTIVGTPTWWYRDGQTTVAVYPASTTASLAVRYVAKPALLTAGTDQVVIPTEWCDLVVDGAVLRGKKDNDDYDAFATQYETDIKKMTAAELIDGGNPASIVVTSVYDG